MALKLRTVGASNCLYRPEPFTLLNCFDYSYPKQEGSMLKKCFWIVLAICMGALTVSAQEAPMTDTELAISQADACMDLRAGSYSGPLGPAPHPQYFNLVCDLKAVLDACEKPELRDTASCIRLRSDFVLLPATATNRQVRRDCGSTPNSPRPTIDAPTVNSCLARSRLICTDGGYDSMASFQIVSGSRATISSPWPWDVGDVVCRG